MTTKTVKNEMLQAHEAIAAALEAKIGNLPEWQAFRHLDRALLALEAEQSEPPKAAPIQRYRARLNGAPIPYMTLADQALAETGKPITTSALMEYILQRRPLAGADPDKVKTVVQSSLSKDKRFKSIPWGDVRAWWYADRPIPKKETAGG